MNGAYAVRPPRLELNPIGRMHIALERLGEDRNPVLVVDDVLANADEVRGFALGLAYAPGRRTAYYPGYTSACALPGTLALARFLAEYLWRECYGLARRTPPFVDPADVQAQSFFALFAPSPDAKYSIQHVDGHSWLASVLYLAGDRVESGTAFWRDRATQLQSKLPGNILLAQKIEAFFGTRHFAALERAFLRGPEVDLDAMLAAAAAGRPSPRFPAAGDDQWDLLKLVPARYNRLVCYPTWQIHSVAYPDYRPPESVESARLTLNTFVEYPLPGLAPTVPVAPLAGVGA